MKMKAFKVIKDPAAFKLLGDETRRKMVFLLRVKEMTVSQVAAELNITPQAVYHHIKKLQKGDMVEVAREERVGHLIESYYTATAEAFMCSVGGNGSKESGVKQVKEVLQALQKIGFNLTFNEDQIAQLVEIQQELKDCCGAERFEDAIEKLDDVDVFTKQLVQEYAETMSMSEQEFNKQQEVRKNFRNALISLTHT